MQGAKQQAGPEGFFVRGTRVVVRINDGTWGSKDAFVILGISVESVDLVILTDAANTEGFVGHVNTRVDAGGRCCWRGRGSVETVGTCLDWRVLTLAIAVGMTRWQILASAASSLFRAGNIVFFFEAGSTNNRPTDRE
jgi:hypothetical protein